MKGLFLKDIINLKQQVKIYIIIISVWLVLSITNNDADFFSGVMMIFTVLVPLSAIAYDEKAKWDRYALTMPVSRMDIVLSKYLLALTSSIVGAILSTIIRILLTKEITKSFISSLMFMALGMTFVSIVLPIIFKFGVEKGRIIMLAVVLLPTVITLLISKLNLSFPMGEIMDKLISFSPVIAIFVVTASIFISKKIYLNKEL